MFLLALCIDFELQGGVFEVFGYLRILQQELVQARICLHHPMVHWWWAGNLGHGNLDFPTASEPIILGIWPVGIFHRLWRWCKIVNFDLTEVSQCEVIRVYDIHIYILTLHSHSHLHLHLHLHIRLHERTLHYHTLPYITMHHHALPCTTMHYHTLPCITIHYDALPYITLHYHTYKAIQYNANSAMQCNTRQHKTIQYNTMQCNTIQYNNMHTYIYVHICKYVCAM